MVETFNLTSSNDSDTFAIELKRDISLWLVDSLGIFPLARRIFIPNAPVQYSA